MHTDLSKAMQSCFCKAFYWKSIGDWSPTFGRSFKPAGWDSEEPLEVGLKSRLRF